MHRQLYVVSHTHWDREWYHTSARFRQRLVPLIDALLDGAHDLPPFLLDGQAIVLADYLSVRPERAALLQSQLAAGALEAGPWYVLADNLLPCGEAMVRNMEAGRRLLTRLGATPPRVAYCPDTFGHPAALPTIAAGFGCDTAVLWRGFGGEFHPPVDTFWWHGADDARLVVYHLPRDGYEFGGNLPLDADAAAQRWCTIRDELASRNRSGVMLLLNGADHHAAQPQRVQRIAALRECAAHDNTVVVAASLSRFADALRAVACESSLPDVRGELRDSYGYTWTLQGTFATRAAQKRRNAHLERDLLRDVEPWIALAWLHDQSATPNELSEGRMTVAQAPALLATAWETLLRTHPHDTLCGCSIDAVARAMQARQESVRAQVQGLRRAAIELALAHDPVVARDAHAMAGSRVVIRNRAARARAGIVDLRLIERIGDVRVGPSSAQHAQPRGSTHDAPPVVPPLLIQAMDARLAHERLESPQHYPDDDLVRAHRVVAWLPDTHAVPALGLRVVGAETRSRGSAHRTMAEPRPVVTSQTRGGVTLDNGIMRVRVTSRSVTVAHADRVWRNALVLESTTDAGDSYTPSLRGAPQALTLVRARLLADGPLRAVAQLTWRLPTSGRTPVLSDLARMDTDARDDRRATPMRDGGVSVRTTLVLDAESPVLRCDVHGMNHRPDHRLRLRWNTDVRGDTVWADAAFGPVLRSVSAMASRTVHAARTRGSLIESRTRSMPLHRWVSLSDERVGVAVISDGLAEAEVSDRAIEVTLLRAIGELSRHDLPERPGHAGWPCAIPAAQSLGPFRARIGIMAHGPWGNAALSHVEDACDSLLLPLVGETWRDYRGPTQSIHGPSLVGIGLRSSAVTLSVDADAVLLRAVNVNDAPSTGTWVMPDEGPWLVTPVRMDQTPIGSARECNASITFTAGPRAVVTHRVQRVQR